MEDKKIINEAKTLVQEFLTQMGLDAEISLEFIEAEKENVRYLSIHLTGDNLSELIGFHGKNLEAAQTVLSLILSKRIDQKGIRIIIDINDYKKNREKDLISYALRAVQQVKDSGQKIELRPMKPYERRIVHMILKKEAGIKTESIGEGEERRVVISKDEELF